MALSETGIAIGGVSRLLRDVLTNVLTHTTPPAAVSVGRPEPGSSGGVAAGARVNLFLYETQIEASLRNVPLTQGRQSPLWLVLRYLLTPFDDNGDSDTDTAHDVLGLAMQALLGINQSGALESLTDHSLTDNPQRLRVTFDDGPPDLLSRLMQGPDDRFRMSVPFQIRPVLVATGDPPDSLQLVGINYLTDTNIGIAGVRNLTIPSLGPVISSVTPAQVAPGDTLRINGTGLGVDRLVVRFGPVDLPVTGQTSAGLQCSVGGVALNPATISAGTQSVAVVQTLAGGKTISSNSLSATLIPVLTGVSASNITPVSGANPDVYGAIKVTGQFLGRAADYLEVGLLDATGIALVVDRIDTTFVAPADQSARQVIMKTTEAVPPGTYTVVVRVNGAQARRAFLLNFS